MNLGHARIGIYSGGRFSPHQAAIANRSKKGPGDHHEVASDTTHKKHPDEYCNTSEQGDTANIKQNTTNKGYFRGRRKK